MKGIKLLLILAILLNQFAFGQKMEGVWMSYNNRAINDEEWRTIGNEGYILDFDLNRFGHVRGDSTISVTFNKKYTRMRSKRHKFSWRFQRYGMDSLEFDSGENTMYVFRKLDLTHPLKIEKRDIEKFLINGDFDPVADINLNFSSEQYIEDRIKGKPIKRFNLFVNGNESCGYWYVSEIRDNFFLIFSLGSLLQNKIFQIESVENCVIELIPLQDNALDRSFNKLNSCL